MGGYYHILFSIANNNDSKYIENNPFLYYIYPPGEVLQLKKMEDIKVPKTKSEKNRIIHRLKITRGHLTKLIDMVENDNYCIDLITQSLAVRKAIKSTEAVILGRHLKTCFQKAMLEGSKDDQDRMIKEILDIEDFHDR